MKIFPFLLPIIFLVFQEANAHCPLCTLGIGAAAGGATWLGVKKSIVGLFVGAFASSTGFWFSKSVKKEYVPFQRALIILGSFIVTVIPLLSVINVSSPYYLSLFGEYGSLFNRTYIINLFFVWSIVGAFAVLISPKISNLISNVRGDIFPFQGVVLTLLLLVFLALIVQVVF